MKKTISDETEQHPWYDFVTSTRFWAIVIGVFSIYAEAKGWIGEPEKNAIATLTASFTAVKTVDRYSDKKIEAAEASKPE